MSVSAKAAFAQSVAPPRDLIDQVLKDLVPKGLSGPLTKGLAESVVTRAIDLDGDGRPEWLIVVEHSALCGASGKYCPLAVYANGRSGFRRLFPASLDDAPTPTYIGAGGLARLRVGPHRTAGFLDLAWHFSAGANDPDPYDVTLTYDGAAYRSGITKRKR